MNTSNVGFNVGILSVTPEGFSEFLEKKSQAAISDNLPAAAVAAMRQGVFEDWCDDTAEEECGAIINRAAGVVVQPVRGYMMAGADAFEEACCGCFDTNRLSAIARQVSEDAGIRALILHINSPGGSVAGLAENCAAIVNLAETLPDLMVMAYIDGIGCSAAARVAAACQETHAGIGAMVGSISTIMVAYDDSRMFANAGVEAKVFTDGKFKAAGYPGVPITDEQAALFQEQVRVFGEEFKAFMTARRPGLTDDDMQGQAFIAEAGKYPEALLDGIGWPSFDEFAATVAGMASLTGEQ